MIPNNNEQLQPIPPDRTRLDDAYLQHAFHLETKYLLSIDEDRLLSGFRENAGMDQMGKNRYGGWENSLIGGHTMGHYLSAASRAVICVEACAQEKHDLLEKVHRIVDELMQCQRHSQGAKGFLFGAVLADPDNVEAQFDNVERGLTNIMTEAWVPWYTMHKILAGLLDVYRYTEYEPALAAAENLGNWVADRCLAWEEATVQQVLAIEYGGMNDCMYELYAVTGDARFAKAAHVFDEEPLFERVLSGGKNVLNDLHANTTIPKFVGALNRYRMLHGASIDGQTVDAGRYLEYAKAFWDMVMQHHTYITGGNSEWEHFGLDDVLNAERTNCNNETCNVYNLLKLSHGLYRITGDKKYMDFYERALINTILSSQNPATGMTTYFQPMANGYFKVYGTPFDKFWCCSGSGMENFTRLNEGIYHIKGRELFVNLYFSSGFTDAERGISLTQIADLEETDVVTLVIRTEDIEADPWTLYLRIPDWVRGTVRVNRITGKHKKNRLPYEAVNGYAAIPLTERELRIELTLPKKVYAQALPDAPDVMGFAYGPYVLSVDLGTEDMRTTTTGVDVTIPADRIENCDSLPLLAGILPELVLQKTSRFFLKEPDAPVFEFIGSKVMFSPHYRKHKSRYGIYFKLIPYSEKNGTGRPLAQREKVIDIIQPGYGQYENDVLHGMKEKDSRGITNQGTSRYALPGGYFCYRIAVDPEKDNILEFTVKKSDNGKWLRITADRQVLFDGQLHTDGDEEEYNLRFALPREITKAAKPLKVNGELRHVVELRFSGRKDETSARVCKFIYVKIDRGEEQP